MDDNKISYTRYAVAGRGNDIIISSTFYKFLIIMLVIGILSIFSLILLLPNINIKKKNSASGLPSPKTALIKKQTATVEVVPSKKKKKVVNNKVNKVNNNKNYKNYRECMYDFGEQRKLADGRCDHLPY
jgi:hypothetical protein